MTPSESNSAANHPVNLLAGTQHGWAAERLMLDHLGYSAPLPLADPALALKAFEELGTATAYRKNPHTTSKAVLALLGDTNLHRHVNLLCGHGFNLWRSALFSKTTNAQEIGWHHDKHFQDAQCPDIQLEQIGGHYSILFALSEISQTTGMIEMLPGTHRPLDLVTRDTRPYHQRPPENHILKNLPEALLSQARPVPIPAGSFVIFHSAILHRSQPHGGGPARAGLAIRLARQGLAIPAELAAQTEVVPFSEMAARHAAY